MPAVRSTPPEDRFRPAVSELALARWWHSARFGTPLQTSTGDLIEILHRGSWSHGLGPDFQDAMIVRDGRDLVSGSVELHLRSSDWRNHGHHLDPAYNDVILHAVLSDNSIETRRADGQLVPVVTLDVPFAELVDLTATTGDWSRVGGAVCAEALARERPADVKALLWTLGDRRLAAKTARLEARLTALPPAEVLYQEIMDGLGFMANREPMNALAQRMPISLLEEVLATAPRAERFPVALALFLGCGGFLPLSPHDGERVAISPSMQATIEAHWARYGAPWIDERLPATAWRRARVRPSNDPLLRLCAAAALVSTAAEGFTGTMLGLVRQSAQPAKGLAELSQNATGQWLGEQRATAIVANALLPFAFALAEQTADEGLLDAASAAWERLPSAGANEITRRAIRQVAGKSSLRGLGERGHQGLIHLDMTLCQPRRCFECPIGMQVAMEAESIADLER